MAATNTFVDVCAHAVWHELLLVEKASISISKIDRGEQQQQKTSTTTKSSSRFESMQTCNLLLKEVVW